MKKYFLLALLVWNCSKNSDSDQVNGGIDIPVSLEDGIAVTSISDLGYEESNFGKLQLDLESGAYGNIKSFLISAENKLFFEYTGSSTFNQQFYVQSVTKSFTGALVGLAIEQGLLSLDDLIMPYFINYDMIDWSNGKADITIEHLLTMTTGIQWNETDVPYEDSSNIHRQLGLSDDWIQFILEQPMETSPGTDFNYNSGASILLGYILDEVADDGFYAFAQSNLFDPLGIDTFIWSQQNGVFQTGGGLAVRPRELLKFGLMFSNNGAYNGIQVLPTSWVSYTFNQSPVSNEYSVQWWKGKVFSNGVNYTIHYAWGNGGQFILVIKQLNLVLTLTSENFGNNGFYRDQLFSVIQNQILPAMQ